MVKINKFKNSKFIWTIIILSGLLATFASIILYNCGVTFKKTESTEVIKKLKDIQAKGGVFELNQKDIDEVCSLYFENSKNKGDMTLRGVNIEMSNGEILIKAPISYKNINLLLTSRGRLNFSNGKITYVVDNFKIGNLPLPKNLLIGQISKLSDKLLYAEDNSIKISPKLFPFKINNFKIIDNKILGTAEKLDMKMLFESIDKKTVEETGKKLAIVQQETQSDTDDVNKVKDVNKAEKEKVEESQNIIGMAKSNPVDDKKKLKAIRAEVEKSRQTAQKKESNTLDTQVQAANKRLALNKVHDELKDAYSKVGSSKEKQVLSIMILAVGKLQSNSSYNSTSDQVTVKSMYSNLDPKSKGRLKIALITSVSMESVKQLRQSFGL